MSMTKGQKRARNAARDESRVVTDPARIRELWGGHHWNRWELLRRPDVWAFVKPLALKSHFSQADGDFELFLENFALSDAELVELGVAAAEPLKVLKHPHCGDLTLKKVAEMWERPGHCKSGLSLDCVPSWGTKEQIERMYELHPPCREHNATTGYANFAQRFA